MRTQLANCALFLLSVISIWHCALRIGGGWAGVVASSLLVYHPTLVFYIPQVLTESIYLFGLLLFTAATIEYSLNPRLKKLWLGLLFCGLSITLLTRPELQYFVLLTFPIVLFCTLYIERKLKIFSTSRFSLIIEIINRKLCVALFLALILLAATTIKNGISFIFWRVSTGTGAALYYGDSPFKFGSEPAFSGYGYDTGAIPYAADPETLGNPLMHRPDEINKRAAIDIIKNTSLLDSLKFFSFNLKTRILYSTLELRSEPKRTVRLFELISIALASVALFWRMSNSKTNTPLLPGPSVQSKKRLSLIGGLALAIAGMAIQLSPALYNDRYNIFFMVPWLIILSEISIAILLQTPNIALPRSSNWLTLSQFGLKSRWVSKICIATIILATLPSVLTRHALRHET